MTDKKRKKTGRPEKYPGEKQQRLSVLMRPRYKQSLELIAKQRQTTLSEAAEFAIAYMAMRYDVDGKPLLDYVRPKYELINLLIDTAEIWVFFAHNDLKNHTAQRMRETADHHSDMIDFLLRTPASFRTPLENYQIKVLTGEKQIQFTLALFFNMKELKSIIEEAWKSSFPANTVKSYIKISLYHLIKSYYDFVRDYKAGLYDDGFSVLTKDLGGFNNDDEKLHYELDLFLTYVENTENNLTSIIDGFVVEFQYNFYNKLIEAYKKFTEQHHSSFHNSQDDFNIDEE